nr:hypothetical protein GCM10020092_039300 [Actinoplanes digitatis]
MLGAFLCLVWWGAPVNELLGGVSPAAQAAWAAAVGAVLAGLAFRPGGPRGGGRSAAPLLACALVLADAAAAPTAAYVLRAPFVARDTALAFGLAFLLYAVSYLRPARRSTAEPAWLRSLLVVFVGLFGAAGLFAATDEYARAVGVDEAELTAARLDERRGVVVFSEHDLGLAPVGRCKPVRGRNQAFRLRCDGLRLFVQTPRGLLVISSTWSRADGIGRNDRMIVIPVDDSVRVEFTPGESELPYPEQ